MSYCDTCVVRNSTICAALNASEIEALNAIARRRKLAPGESLVWEGDQSVVVGNVIEGMLKLTSGTQDGREQIVGVVYPADFIGRPFGDTSMHSITALTPANVCVFGRADFDRVASEHPALEHKLLVRTLTELDRTRKWMLLLARKSAAEKVATFLLEMRERLAVGKCDDKGSPVIPDHFELPFTRQQIGDILGLTIETVSRQMTQLRRDGIIDLPTRREVTICDHAALESISG